MLAVVMRGEVTHNVGIQLGWDRNLYRLNAPSVSEKDKNDLSKQPLNGGRLGLVYELASEKGLGFFTAFNYAYTWHTSDWEKIPYNEKGKYTEFDLTKIEYRYRQQMHQLDFNLQAQYKFEIADETYLAFYTGPSVQYIIEYDAQDYFRYNDTKLDDRYYFERPIEYDTEDMASYYKRYNVTWGLGAAFQFDRYYIRGGYEFGLINPYKVTTFGAIQYEKNGQLYNVFEKTDGSHEPDDRLTRGRLDSWNITLGVFLWQSDN